MSTFGPSPLPPTAEPRRHRRRTGAALAALLLLAGCSASGSDTSAADSAAMAEPADGSQEAVPGAGPGAAASAGAAKAADSASIVAAATTSQLARRADLAVQVRAVSEAAVAVRRIVLAADGQVTQEQFGTDSGQPEPAHVEDRPLTHGTMTVSVPTAALDKTLDELATLGLVTDRSVASEDLSGTIVDTTSRVATMRESLARVRALMDQATKLSDIVALESELSQRQSDLEALESALASAKGRVAQSPIVLTLSTATTEQPAATGFLGGLRAGWGAFTSLGAGVLTALGAALPFVLVGAGVGWPLTRWLRRRRPIVAPPAAGPAQS